MLCFEQTHALSSSHARASNSFHLQQLPLPAGRACDRSPSRADLGESAVRASAAPSGNDVIDIGERRQQNRNEGSPRDAVYL